ncbi:hypothetical protein [Vibrio splendidus]|uniref:hypothetical protein n=1 Tax=Vibrio splendidus TaxID=29497 RepID=UPI000C854A9B|nr:hypothetical protein [Vibrio splendidus]PMI28458.1 hypothetical protein BCU48_15445 [Vibrio splendidus]PMM33786.1 hypothetical protein BCT55_20115 [Vibrio splendidus]PMO39207.1 hypothetical protein BCT09_07095 [Vibrio splendidus]PTP59983.1 hypothetical protein CWO31_22675 [Vibrio splendidus]
MLNSNDVVDASKKTTNVVAIKAPMKWVVSDPVHGNTHFDIQSRIVKYPQLKQVILQLNTGLYSLHMKGYSLKSLGQYRRGVDIFLLYLEGNQPIADVSVCGYAFLYSYLKWYQSRPIQEGERRGRLRKSLMIARLIPKLLLSLAETYPEQVHPDVLTGHVPCVRGIPSSPREPYSKREFRSILKACKQIIEQDKNGKWNGSESVLLAAAAVLMSIYTLANKTDILRLTVDSMYPHPHDPERRVCFAFYKPRAQHRTIVKDFDVGDETTREMIAESRLFHTSAKSLFMYLKERSDQYRSVEGLENGQSIWLYRINFFSRTSEKVTTLKAGYLDSSRNTNQNSAAPLDVITNIFELMDDEGEPLRIRLSRLRPTCVQVLRRYGSIASVSRILGHKLRFGQGSSLTTYRHYLKTSPEQRARLSLLLERLHDYSATGKVSSWIQYEKDYELTSEQRSELQLIQSDNRFKTHVASCKNPKNHEQAPLKGPSCLDFMQCLLCPHIVILETDLWRLFSFQLALKRDFESGRLPSHVWIKRYGVYLQILEKDLPAAFKHRPLALAQSLRRAKESPYPLWSLDDQSYLTKLLMDMEGEA